MSGGSEGHTEAPARGGPAATRQARRTPTPGGRGWGLGLGFRLCLLAPVASPAYLLAGKASFGAPVNTTQHSCGCGELLCGRRALEGDNRGFGCRVCQLRCLPAGALHMSPPAATELFAPRAVPLAAACCVLWAFEFGFGKPARQSRQEGTTYHSHSHIGPTPTPTGLACSAHFVTHHTHSHTPTPTGLAACSATCSLQLAACGFDLGCGSPPPPHTPIRFGWVWLGGSPGGMQAHPAGSWEPERTRGAGANRGGYRLLVRPCQSSLLRGYRSNRLKLLGPLILSLLLVDGASRGDGSRPGICKRRKSPPACVLLFVV
jgi:hypothetical protein